jgi:hypothetical protein
VEPGWWIVLAVGIAVATANARTLPRLWSSAGLERWQKVAQTALMWLVPGTYLFVRAGLANDTSRPAGDSASGNAESWWVWTGSSNLLQESGGHHGDDTHHAHGSHGGGGHGGHDGGGHGGFDGGGFGGHH